MKMQSIVNMSFATSPRSFYLLSFWTPPIMAGLTTITSSPTTSISIHLRNHFYHAFFCTFSQVSLRAMVRLKRGCSGVES